MHDAVFVEIAPRIEGQCQLSMVDLTAARPDGEQDPPAPAGAPGLVPDDLHIPEPPVPEVPARPRELLLGNAPLEQLLSTACAGTLPRWLEKSVAAAREELEAMLRRDDYPQAAE